MVHGRVRLVIPRVLRHVARHGNLGRGHVPRVQRRRHGGRRQAGARGQVVRVMVRVVLVLLLRMVVGRTLGSRRWFARRLGRPGGVGRSQGRRTRGARSGVRRVGSLARGLGGPNAARGRRGATASAAPATLLLGLEHFLVLGASILKPYFHLRVRKKNNQCMRAGGHGSGRQAARIIS